MAVSGFLSILGTAAVNIWPNMESKLSVLLWAIPLTALITSILIGLISTPYLIYKEETSKIKDKASKDFYLIDDEAKMYKIHYEFYRFWRGGTADNYNSLQKN